MFWRVQPNDTMLIFGSRGMFHGWPATVAAESVTWHRIAA